LSQDTTGEPINLDRFEHEFFRVAMRRRISEYYAHFGDRLAAIYVSGSVHRKEAVQGTSDLDLCYFITDTFGEADEAWIGRVRKELDRDCPGIHGTTRPRSVEVLRTGLRPDADADARIRTQAWGIRLRYDATIIWGRDLSEGLALPPPDRAWAQLWFPTPWELIRHAAGLLPENNTDFDLPDGLPLRLRKLARLAILGGAALLMARGEFRSFRGVDVLPPLKRSFPEWAAFLDETRGLYIQPVSPSPEQVSAYLSHLVTWMDWIGAQLHEERP
jgi:hypothetical protein